MNSGRLFVAATPIGNLDDISYRAVETLKSCDFIICEDTRISSRVLEKYGIKKKLVSINARTEEKKTGYVIDRILNGEDCALISDAGTPAISDPGVRLIHAAHSNGIEVSGIPGPNAAILALSISGIPTDAFIFEGFLPQKKGRQKKLKSLAEEERTIVLYESTYRIEKLIDELAVYIPERYVVVCRELTKKFEEQWRGTPSELSDMMKTKTIKGEFVVIISPKSWREKKG
jgi:16S rRNA (cytidine1402-2'-O)-methyltransferase